MKFRWLTVAGFSAASALSVAAFAPSTVCAQETNVLDVSGQSSSSEQGDEVVTVSIAPLDRLLPNVTYLMRLVGAGAQSGIVTQAVNGYTSGLDRARPIGAFVTLGDAGVPVSVAALPISDLDSFLGGLELFGEAEDLGDGLYSMSLGPNTIFAQHTGDWLFVSSSEESLEGVYGSSAERLDKMASQHDLLVEVNVQNIPDDLIDLLTSQMRSGFEQAIEAQSGDMEDEELEASRASGEQMMKNMEEIFTGTEKFVVGLGIRPKEKNMFIDFGSRFVDGSRFAKQMKSMESAKSKLSGFLSDESMMNYKALMLVAPEDMAQIESSLDAGIKAAYKQIDDNSNGNTAAAAKAKEYLDRLVKIFLESGKEGSVEIAANVATNPSLNVLLALSVADGTKVEQLAKDLATEASNANAPLTIELMSGKHQGFNLHRISAPLPENAPDEQRKIWGDSINVSIGTSPKGILLSVGKTAEASLKAAIDGVASNPNTAASPARMRMDMSQLLNFVQTFESNPIVDGMLSALSSGDDMVMIDSKVVDRGSVARFTIQEGVLKAIAGGVKAGMAGQGGDF
jgi:hypothetical protein